MSEPKSAFQFRHPCLNSLTSTRILYLLPSSCQDAALQCRLVEVELQEAPKYNALSYVWGDELNFSSIFYNEAEIPITLNLEAALKQFRDSKQEIALWVDSICINQEDMVEKAKQIQIMGDIYSKAEKVLIWFGSENEFEDTSSAYDLAMTLINIPRSKWNELRPQKVSLHSITAELGIPDLDSPGFIGIRDFATNRPWFRRAWTFQESYLSTDKLYQCGTKILTQDHIANLCVALHSLQECTQDERLAFVSDRMRMSSLFRIMTWKDANGRSGSYLRDLLSNRRGSECKEPSDLVYSILGVAKDVGAIGEVEGLLRPDYKEPFPAVFARCILYDMLHWKDLSILSLADSTCRREWPSWLPDLRHRVLKSHVWYSRNDPQGGRCIYHASGASPAAIHLLDDQKRLKIEGIIVDTVLSTQLAPLVCRNWSWLNSQLDWKANYLASYQFGNQTNEQAVVRTILTDLWSPTASSIRQRLEEQDCEMLWRRNTDYFYYQPSAGVKQEQVKPSDDKADFSLLEFALDIAGPDIGQKCLMMTERRILGNVSDAVAPGDIVTVVLGGSVPLVLRPCGSHFELVGECYLHGFMDGEAFIEARLRTDLGYDGVDKTWLARLDKEPVPFQTREFILV